MNFYCKKTLLFLSSLVLLGLVLSSCALPSWQRYKNINEVKDQLSYQNLGNANEEYDSGDGIFSPSYIIIKIPGKRTVYEQLQIQLKEIKNAECSNIEDGKNRTTCDVGQVDINLVFVDEEDSTYTYLQITDRFSGRDVIVHSEPDSKRDYRTNYAFYFLP